MMGEVFEDPAVPPPSEAYVAGLLDRPDLWAYAAVADGAPVGGLTAFVLPLTRAEAGELFLYDLAVRPDHQRRGVGRALLERLRADGAAAGVAEVWVPADDEDTHALDFYRRTGGTGQAVTIFTYPTR
jgi:aminoglycoside 3-N-acetyltransferase I